jgi:small subunit ribosomal protein S15
LDGLGAAAYGWGPRKGILAAGFVGIGPARPYATAIKADGDFMPLAPEKKTEVIKSFARDGKDTGSPEVQIAILTARIQQVATHLRANKLDAHNRRGLVQMVSKRNRLLRYLSRTDNDAYKATIQKLGLRK